ncbi:hypothetical protein TNCV_1434101 [Trichonephila clavipes]|nr:hypothetical protein TNCV_1434101 [Trichonephila clavipes]
MHYDGPQQCRFIHWALGAGTQGPGGIQNGPDKLDLTKFSGYKFRSFCAKGSCRSPVPRALNEFKLALVPSPVGNTAVFFVSGEPCAVGP